MGDEGTDCGCCHHHREWSRRVHERNGQLTKYLRQAHCRLLAGDPAGARALIEEVLGMTPEQLEEAARTQAAQPRNGRHPNGMHPRHRLDEQRKRKKVSAAQRRRIFERDGNRCRACGWAGSGDRPLTIDHIIPISWGGTNQDANLQVLCTRCNQRKNKEQQVHEPPYDLSRYELRRKEERAAAHGAGQERARLAANPGLRRG